ncbi:MAG: hypothetical protein NVSMB18_04500 [Acetobacteraceae bacterium]
MGSEDEMDIKEAIVIAKGYVNEILAEEQVTNLGVEETEHDPRTGGWLITRGFSRPWNTPKTRAQEVLENLGAVSNLRRSFKVVSVSLDGQVVSMKNRQRADVD